MKYLSQIIIITAVFLVGEIEEAMCGLFIAVCGIITVILASFMAMIPM